MSATSREEYSGAIVLCIVFVTKLESSMYLDASKIEARKILYGVSYSIRTMC